MSSYMKFFGSDAPGGRANRNYQVRDEIIRSECHCVAGFSRKPLTFKADDTFYMGRMVNHPNDYIVFGKGIVAAPFQLLRDKATASDIDRINFRGKWPYYIQLINTVFINGPISNGITIESLIKEHQRNAFVNAVGLAPHQSIRTLFMKKAYVELTQDATTWLDAEFSNRMTIHGTVDQNYLREAPKPENALCQF